MLIVVVAAAASSASDASKRDHRCTRCGHSILTLPEEPVGAVVGEGELRVLGLRRLLGARGLVMAGQLVQPIVNAHGGRRPERGTLPCIKHLAAQRGPIPAVLALLQLLLREQSWRRVRRRGRRHAPQPSVVALPWGPRADLGAEGLTPRGPRRGVLGAEVLTPRPQGLPLGMGAAHHVVFEARQCLQAPRLAHLRAVQSCGADAAPLLLLLHWCCAPTAGPRPAASVQPLRREKHGYLRITFANVFEPIES
mmetsp:Transcript_44570/g.142876  ORF Transcript_44570/g.142876 Transcript_44570/m.142876 type:complete len:252 (+) Transcript_44570:1179-1934(+)